MKELHHELSCSSQPLAASFPEQGSLPTLFENIFFVSHRFNICKSLLTLVKSIIHLQ